MRALAWFGTNDVRMIDAPIPDITDPEDVIVRVTGTTICGSDLHLCVSSSFRCNCLLMSLVLARYHGEIMTLQEGDVLGHEVRSQEVFGLITTCR
jgi:threonine dehydrogenase-like Zn-dependent dehydrogenase